MTDRHIPLVFLAVLATAGTGAATAAARTPATAVAATPATITVAATPATTAAVAKSCTRPSFKTSSRDGGATYGRYYVYNNMWNPLSVKQTLYTCNYDSWYVEATMTSQGGAVQTYPNSQMTFHHSRELRRISSLSSSFAESTTPSRSGDDYEYAYDIWINGYGGAGTSELMIWNYDDGQSPSGSRKGTFSDDGHTFDVYVTGTASSGDYIAFVATSNFTAGTYNLVDFFRHATSKGWVDHGSSAKLWQVDYGVEICSTGGHRAKFDFTNFDVVPVYGHAGTASTAFAASR